MSFTDDDLKRLKEGYWFTRVPIQNVGQSESFVWCDGDKVLALLARLEAAEEFAEEAICHCKFDCLECGELREIWERTRGK